MIKLGQKLRDKVTGLEGIAVAKVEYLNGCIQFCIKPKSKTKNEVKMPEGVYIDEGQLEIVSKGLSTSKKREGPGGVMNDTPNTSYRN